MLLAGIWVVRFRVGFNVCLLDLGSCGVGII